MTNEQINAAIAEACGWTNLELCTCKLTTRGTRPVGSCYGPHIPDYCNDLNAMHEAESWMIKNKSLNTFWKYAGMLKRHFTHLGDDGYIHATARQRAEAFLRALGKWATVNDSLTAGKEVQP